MIVAKFSSFKDREMVLKWWKEMDGTVFRVFERFPVCDPDESEACYHDKRREAARGAFVHCLRHLLYRRGTAGRIGER
ncbi:hypothetical protein DPMN_096789 [Dreissena polymorpha]|uniref:Uncharacterized protein n=1 Tax=Dreissena polymorpha TaxID=45954 RepID=A0A9D4R3Z4_DREPO|nr:hypothetical protein DPMN_096789 [Dreissena polymorpha]